VENEEAHEETGIAYSMAFYQKNERMDYQTQPPESGELEAHRRYLDIQMLLSGFSNHSS